MTGSGERSDSERRDRRGREARERADRARLRANEAADRLAQLRNADSLIVSGGEPQGSTFEQADRAAELARTAKDLAARAAGNAAAAVRASAKVHDEAARLHDRSADLGLGDVDAHRRLAGEHRDHAEADRAEALIDDYLGERIRHAPDDRQG